MGVLVTWVNRPLSECASVPGSSEASLAFAVTVKGIRNGISKLVQTPVKYNNTGFTQTNENNYRLKMKLKTESAWGSMSTVQWGGPINIYMQTNYCYMTTLATQPYPITPKYDSSDQC